jgi:hypothetical protein
MTYLIFALHDSFVVDVSPAGDRGFVERPSLRQKFEEVSLLASAVSVMNLYSGNHLGVRASLVYVEVMPFAEVVHTPYCAA